MFNCLRPIQAHFSITYQCDHHCFYCFPENDVQQLNENDVVNVVKKAQEGGILSVVITGGEVFSRKDFLSILERVHKTGILFHIETNGTKIQEEEAEQLKHFDTLVSVDVCIDGTPPVHDAIHEKPGAFQKTMRALTYLYSAGVPVEVHTVLSQKNVQILDELVEMTHNLHVKRHTLLPLVGHTAFQLSSEQYSTVRMKIEQWKLEYPEFPILLRRNGASEGMLSPLYINPLGYVSPCPYDECCAGNILEEDIDRVLSSVTAYYNDACKKCRRWKE